MAITVFNLQLSSSFGLYWFPVHRKQAIFQYMMPRQSTPMVVVATGAIQSYNKSQNQPLKARKYLPTALFDYGEFTAGIHFRS